MDETEGEFPTWGPLYDAVTSKDNTSLRTLLEGGAKLDEEATWDGDTALHAAVRQGNLEAVQLLLKAGCPNSLDGFDHISHTPLMWAAKEGRSEIARALIGAGANLNAHDVEQIGDSAIRVAVEAADFEMVKLLLDAGADPTVQGWMGGSALSIAKHQAESAKRTDVYRRISELFATRRTK